MLFIANENLIKQMKQTKQKWQQEIVYVNEWILVRFVVSQYRMRATHSYKQWQRPNTLNAMHTTCTTRSDGEKTHTYTQFDNQIKWKFLWILP